MKVVSKPNLYSYTIEQEEKQLVPFTEQQQITLKKILCKYIYIYISYYNKTVQNKPHWVCQSLYYYKTNIENTHQKFLKLPGKSSANKRYLTRWMVSDCTFIKYESSVNTPDKLYPLSKVPKTLVVDELTHLVMWFAA